MRARAGAALLAVLLAVAATGCDTAVREQQAEEAEAAAQGPPAPTDIPKACDDKGRPLRIGLVPINLQALFFNQIVSGAKRVADEAGVGLQVVNGDDDSVTQADAVANLAAKDVDAIIVDAVDTEGIKPAIRDADAAGVPVVAVDATVDDPAVSVQVGTDNAAGGADMGDFLAKESGGKGRVDVVGALNSTIQLERQKGFAEAAEDGGMSVGTVVDGRNIQEDAQTAAENLLTGNPDARFVYATGEPALIGLAAAVRGQGATETVRVVGWDLSQPAVDGLRAGWVSGVVQQNTFEFGHRSMAAAIRLACGADVDKKIPVPTEIVTPENVQDYLYYLEK
ncbi:monosaccharide ABC transporter substrate-binding protein (CUT2 family) [Murinocardiopsis flavida]|uniref:Monosaccharide ABC transporter substrate-binding protein (CUT2 family) n=1 Tax=Murinocardiopsis flavida TaxID=645275 RepID=A0A2P8DRX3_9ACTN|nr:substrate-binding domain-containing protein [Murinocardiopsis flavida]PSK99934.1 monosaccharide ABC transporter substrate-binding protein (CUT2 family) [Murinocardiopsis flavida]